MVVNLKKDIVGRNPDPKVQPKSSSTPKPTPKPTATKSPLPVFPTATPTAPAAPQDDVIGAINRKNQAKGLPTLVPEVSSALSAQVGYTDAELTTIGKLLKKLNYTVKPIADSVRNTIQDNPELLALQTKNPLYSDFVNALSQAYLPGLDSGTQAKFEGPSRNIYQYNDADIDTLINSVFEKKLMRKPTAEELASFRPKVKPKLEEGTVSTTKLQKNPATGVMEQVTTQQAGMTKEAVATSIEQELEKLNPDEVDRTARINFSSWLSQNAQGA